MLEEEKPSSNLQAGCLYTLYKIKVKISVVASTAATCLFIMVYTSRSTHQVMHYIFICKSSQYLQHRQGFLSSRWILPGAVHWKHKDNHRYNSCILRLYIIREQHACVADEPLMTAYYTCGAISCISRCVRYTAVISTRYSPFVVM